MSELQKHLVHANMGDITQASPPFDQDSADVVLRSSDRVEFKVHSVILAQASPFFQSMFTLPQPGHNATALPVVDCDEDSRVLRDILTICYPVVNPKPYPFQDIETTFRAAQKYEMELPIQFLKDELCAEVRLSRGTSALRVWAAACRLQCEDIAKYPTPWMNLTQVKTAPTHVFKGVSAGDLFRLRQYYSDGQTLSSLSYSFLKHPAGSSPSDTSLPESTIVAQTEMEAMLKDASVEDIADPNVICRSSDGIDFPAHRAVLAIASPVVRDRLQKMEQLLQHESGSPSQGASTPVLRFDERGVQLKHLLDICYHRTVPIPTSPAELASIIAAATKYDMTHAMETLRPHWAAAASKSPLAAYLCATAEDIPAWAMETLPHLLCLPATKIQEYDSAMETAPATQYHRLLMYYDACGSAVVAELEKLKKEHANPVLPPQPSSSTPGSGGLFGNTTIPVNAAFGLGGEFGGGFSGGAFNNAGQQAPSAFGKPSTSSFGQQPWTHPPPDFSKYFVLTFLDKLAKFTGHGPGRKVVTAKNISSEYLKWRSAGKPSPRDPLQAELEAKTVLELSDSLPKRLEDAMKTVVLDLSSDV